MLLFYGDKLSERFKLQVMFFFEAIVMFFIGILAHYITDDGTAFWACFALLLFFGSVNGICQC